MAQLKVLLISVRADLGGGPRYMEDFARSLVTSHEVYIASPEQEPYADLYRDLSRAHFILPVQSFKLLTLWRLWRFAHRHGIQVVHSHGRGAGLYSRALRFFGFPVVHTYHGIHKAPGFVGRLKYELDRLLSPWTDAFVFSSESERRHAEKEGFTTKKASQVIYPISRSTKTSKSEPRPRPTAPIEAERPSLLGCIARFDYAKGLDLLLKHLSAFKNDYPNIQWRLRIAGGGQENFVIPPNIAEQVELLGPINEPLKFLRELDAYVAASRWESFNISVLEALSQGVPALISNVPGHEYFIAEGVATGFDLQNSEDFCEKLKALLLTPKFDAHLNWVETRHGEMKTEGLYSRLLSQ